MSIGSGIYVVLAAVLLDFLLGDPRWLPHPVVYMGKLITVLEKGLRRIVSNEQAGGILLLLITVGTSYGVAQGILTLAYAEAPMQDLPWRCRCRTGAPPR